MPTLSWNKREEAVRAATRAPYRLLELVAELSHGDADTENLLIQGDNLDALKALLPYYAGRVKCVTIDPPFNTQQAFENYDDNLEHSIWLSLMYPRLEFLRDLLADDGSLFIHIDDNELGYLIAIADEVMGRRNRVSIVTFKQGAATGHKAINPGMVTTTNFLVVYAKSKDDWKPSRLFTERERDDRYNQFIVNIGDEYSQWKTIPLSKAFAETKGTTPARLKKELGKERFETSLVEFVMQNASRVIRTARPDYDGVGARVREVIDASKENPSTLFLLRREDYPEMYFKNGERCLFYKNKLKEVDGQLVAGEPLTTLWDDILSNNLHNEGGVSFPKGKKPEGLVKRVLELATNPGDLVLDSFLGSGTTAAAAHKMGRRWIGIEMGEHAVTHCVPRLKKVVDGEQGGISQAAGWKGGGGFRFCRLGPPIFDENDHINKSIPFPVLAAHVWFSETHTPLVKASKSPLLGVHKDAAYYLLFNGILGDTRPGGGNVLTGKLLAKLPRHDGPKVIYGECTSLGEERLRREGVVFKQIPYDMKRR
jgi:adenine-specific DNA-methyltransferase